MYPIARNDSQATLKQTTQEWKTIIHEGISGMRCGLEQLAAEHNMTIIFTEVGYCSGDCPTGQALDIHYQTLRYETFFDVWENIHWFGGVFWWNWLSDPAFGGIYNYCATPQFKPAEELLHKKFGGTGKSLQPASPPNCPCI